jgi:site-specific recombinase XerD
MNGRLEKELLAEKKMQEKLKGLPKIFSEYYVYLRAGKKTYTTISKYMNYIVNFAASISQGKISNDFYKSISTSDIEGYLISLETREVDGQLVRTGSDIQCARWSGLNTFFDFLVRRDHIAVNPVVKTTRPKNNTEHTVTYLTKQEIKKIMNTIDKNTSQVTKVRDKTIVALALSTGMRVDAITNINITDINFEEKFIDVIEKGNKRRQIPIGDNMIELLIDWIKVRNKKFEGVSTSALFVSNKRVRITTKAVRDVVKKYSTQAGINKRITPHKCRSSAATNLAAAGVSIQAIAKQLGHSNVSVTQRYIDVLKEESDRSVKVLDNLF